MENPIKMGWFGGAIIFGNTHMVFLRCWWVDVEVFSSGGWLKFLVDFHLRDVSGRIVEESNWNSFNGCFWFP